MFEYVTGKFAYRGLDYCVVDVGGFGVKIFTTLIAMGAVGEIGSQVTFYTYMAVKEDDISLYGFATREELASFKLLLTVSGIGPKGALSVLSALSSQDFSLAVVSGDYKKISNCKGIGAKTAQKIVLELKDKIAKEFKGEIGSNSKDMGFDVSPIPKGYIGSDAVSALMVLGYTSKEASAAVSKAFKDGMTLEETVREALRVL